MIELLFWFGSIRIYNPILNCYHKQIVSEDRAKKKKKHKKKKKTNIMSEAGEVSTFRTIFSTC